MANSKIEWTEQTWNPIIGCSKISEGCENCYAETMAARLKGMYKSTGKPTKEYMHVIDENLTDKYWNGKTSLVKSALKKPLKRKKPTMYFVCSMGDLFHESVPFEWIDKVLTVIYNCPQHTFQILTKRPERMLKYWKRCYKEAGVSFEDTVPSKNNNIWWGVTAENQVQANKRIPILLQVPAGKHFVSIEPMLGAIDISLWMVSGFLEPPYTDVLDWVILGGETGAKARPMHSSWVESIQKQCEQSNTPFFFKQWGEFSMTRTPQNFSFLKKEQTAKATILKTVNLEPERGKVRYIGMIGKSEGIWFEKVGKKKSGNLLNGKTYQEYPTKEVFSIPP